MKNQIIWSTYFVLLTCLSSFFGLKEFWDQPQGPNFFSPEEPCWLYAGSNIRFFPPSMAYPRGEFFGPKNVLLHDTASNLQSTDFFPTEHGRVCRHVILGPGFTP